MKKKFQKSFQKNCDFLKYFLPILHNIGLYIYTVKYKSGIKIPGFLRIIQKSKKNQNILKKISKTFKSISLFKKIFCFHAYGHILKKFPSMFSLKDCIFLMFWKSKKNGYRNQFMIIH